MNETRPGGMKKKLLMAFVAALTLTALLFATGAQTAYAGSIHPYQYACKKLSSKKINNAKTRLTNIGDKEGPIYHLELSDGWGEAFCLQIGFSFEGGFQHTYSSTTGSSLGYSSAKITLIRAIVAWYGMEHQGDMCAYAAAQVMIWYLIQNGDRPDSQGELDNLVTDTENCLSSDVVTNLSSLYSYMSYLNSTVMYAPSTYFTSLGIKETQVCLYFWKADITDDQNVVTWDTPSSGDSSTPGTGTGTSSKYVIRYYKNDGSGSYTDGGSTTTLTGNTTLASSSEFSRTNYALDGWNTSSAGSGTSYNCGASVLWSTLESDCDESGKIVSGVFVQSATKKLKTLFEIVLDIYIQPCYPIIILWAARNFRPSDLWLIGVMPNESTNSNIQLIRGNERAEGADVWLSLYLSHTTRRGLL